MATRADNSLVFSDELEEFAYATSHDLRSPLRAIENITQWIEEDVGSSRSPELESHFKLLHLRVARMNRLLDDLLSYSRAATRPGAVTDVNLNELVREVAAAMPPRQGIRIDIDPSLPVLRASESALGQVLGQLIANALRHHDKLSGRVQVSAKSEGDAVEITVKDDGPGIDPKNHARIFKICQTLKPKEGDEGSGVGLALVKKIVEKHGGSVTVQSSPGQGSSFCVRWPQES